MIWKTNQWRRKQSLLRIIVLKEGKMGILLYMQHTYSCLWLRRIDPTEQLFISRRVQGTMIRACLPKIMLPSFIETKRSIGQ